uniref:Uncharacterized protein n=1 Tax=Leptobrachium leishanense TaxID=445787 RepID=A0A8C5Q5E9_9ANUR
MNPSSVCLLRCFLRPPHGGGFTSGLIPGAADNETCSLVEGRSLLRCRLYAVIFPSEIRVLSPQLACLHVEGASGETSVQLTLTSSNGNTSLIDKSFQLDSLFTCIPFQIPNPSEQNEEVCTINVVIKMPQETLFKQTKVLLKKERSSVVVQTDKPIYKPGQTVKFRVISLTENLQPEKNQDPANNRIGQWLNVTLNEGISEFSLPLSAEPTLGDYKVWVKGKVSTFSVQEYGEGHTDTRAPYSPLCHFMYFTLALCVLSAAQIRDPPPPPESRHDFMFSLLISCLAICRVLHGDHPLSSTQARTTEEQTQPILRLVVPDHSNAYLYLSSFYSRSKSFLKLRSLGNVLPCEGQQEVQMDYIINGAKLDMETKKLDFHYLVRLPRKGNLINSMMLPFLAYILLPDGEIAADSAKFTVQRCFKNKVSVGFTPDEVLPGSDVSLQIQADPGSLCGLRVVDHSVILMKPEKESKAVLLYPPQAAYARNPEYSICKEGANKGCFPRQPNHNKSFQCAGRYLAQGCVLKTHTCLFVSSDCHFISHCCGFLYRDSGSVVLHETAPDTITDWNAGAFCMGPSGFGLASPASLRVFQPFFVDLTLPYSVVRGESFTLKASVFNYLKECIKVQLTYKHGDGSYSAFGKTRVLISRAFIYYLSFFSVSLQVDGLRGEDPLVADALSCLRKAAVDVSNVYTQALLAYTFTLAEDTETRQILLEKLEKQAVRKGEDGQLHWERPSAKPTSDHPFWYRAPSAEVELTSYMLMTSLSGPEKNLGRASEIVNWLSKQQNPYGGFSSTQDTVVALHDAGDVTVTVRSQTGVQEFHVDNTNRLLLQKASLPDIPGDYTLTASGSGCVYVQTVLRYNVPPPRSDATFVIRVEVKPDQCPEEAAKKLQLNIYTEYTGPREKSNMALIEVKMLSGYIPVKISVREVSHSLHGFQFLFNKQLQVISWGSCLCLSDIEVKNLKPATVKVFDYYETGKGVC